MTYEKIINILKVKWWVIILCGLICAGLMVYEKKNSDYVLQTGDTWVVDAVKLYGFAEDFKLEKFITSYVFLSVFLSETQVKYDYTKYAADWNKFSELEKYEWLKKHIFISNFGKGIYEITFFAGKNDLKNHEYFTSSAENLISELIRIANNKIVEFDSGVKIHLVHTFKMRTDSIKMEENQVEKKYALTGFVLGVILSACILSVSTIREKNGD